MATSPQGGTLYLGLQVSGDIGPMTCYTQLKSGHRSIVLYPKIWLSDPSSLRQVNHRNRVRTAANNWQRLQPADRMNWTRMAKKLSLRCNGYAVWVRWQLNKDRSEILTLQRQSNIQLLNERTDP